MRTHADTYGLTRLVLRSLQAAEEPIRISALQFEVGCNRIELIEAFRMLELRGYKIVKDWQTTTFYISLGRKP